ncbi:MAG TPA: D-alanyl-D-alanine carboxypeptidase [Patescibacteria group bacterium]|nr:D-alanyl-D-alanine carboxypeptidase [Patescibacteria group bacterium]
MKVPKISKSYFLYFLMLSFVFIATTALSLSKIEKIKPEEKLVSDKIETKNFIPNPILKENTNTFPIVSAQAALAIDLSSMTPLYEKNPDLTLLPASTTKIVTALVAMDYFQDNNILKVDGFKTDGQKVGLVEGEEITAGNLLDALLIFSANDAAETLAQNYPGGVEGFVVAMNEKVKEYNLTNTYFDNPVGFDGNNHYSTARDLIRIAMIAMRNPHFAQRVNQKEKIITSVDGKIIHKIVSTNKLLGTVEGVSGVKTGWTENARENLVTYIERGDKKVMIALLGSQDRFGETKEIINWIFSNYEWKEVKFTYSP